MRRLVCDDARPLEQLILRRRFVEHQACRVVEDRAGVLHAAELKRWDQHEVELAPRIFDVGVILQPLECLRMQIEERLAIARDLCRIRLAMKEPQCASVALRGLDGELASDEREEIRRQRRRLLKRRLDGARRRLSGDLRTVCHRLPTVRGDERQAISRLEIRLVKTRERQTRSRRHEQRVEKLIVPIEGIVASEKLEFDLVGTGLRHLGRDDDVAVANGDSDDTAGGANLRQPFGRLREVEDHGLGLVE
jgi:hypothetical protein